MSTLLNLVITTCLVPLLITTPARSAEQRSTSARSITPQLPQFTRHSPQLLTRHSPYPLPPQSPAQKSHVIQGSVQGSPMYDAGNNPKETLHSPIIPQLPDRSGSSNSDKRRKIGDHAASFLSPKTPPPASRLIQLLLLCPSESNFTIQHFVQRPGIQDITLLETLDAFWISLLCGNYELAFCLLDWAAVYKIKDVTDTDEDLLIGISSYIQMDHHVIQRILFCNIYPISPILADSVSTLISFMDRNKLSLKTMLSPLDVAIILDLQGKAIPIFSLMYFEGANTKVYNISTVGKEFARLWYDEYSKFWSPFYYVMRGTTKDGKTRNIEEQWKIASSIIAGAMADEGGGELPIELFIGDVFFLAIMRDMLLLECNNHTLLLSDHIISFAKDQFEYKNFMSAPYEWQGIRLCGDQTDIYADHKASTSSNPPSVIHPIFRDKMPSIVTIEPQRNMETEQAYYQVVVDHLINAKECDEEDFTLVFGSVYWLSTEEWLQQVKLPPLMSIAEKSAHAAAQIIGDLGKSYKVLVKGTVDLTEWAEHGQNVYSGRPILSYTSSLRVSSPSPGTVFLPTKSKSRPSPDQWSQMSLASRYATPELQGDTSYTPRSRNIGNSPILSPDMMEQLTDEHLPAKPRKQMIPIQNIEQVQRRLSDHWGENSAGNSSTNDIELHLLT